MRSSQLRRPGVIPGVGKSEFCVNATNATFATSSVEHIHKVVLYYVPAIQQSCTAAGKHTVMYPIISPGRKFATSTLTLLQR